MSLTLVLVCGLGLLNFDIERDPAKIWTPENSKLFRDMQWLTKNYENGYREQTVLIKAKNVLDPQVLAKIAIIDNAVKEFRVEQENEKSIGWKDVCFRYVWI